MRKVFVSTLCFLFILPIIASALSVSDIISKAGTSVPFGGHSTIIIPCLCSPVPSVWISFNPFFVGSVPLPVGAITYKVTAKTYAYFTAGLPDEWYVGKFTPKPSVSCLIPVVGGCITLPDYGFINMVGTGIPGSAPGKK